MRFGYACASLLISLSTCLGGTAEPGQVRADTAGSAHATAKVTIRQARRPDKREETFSPADTQLDERAPEHAARALLQAKAFSAAEDLLAAALAVAQDSAGIGRKQWQLAQAQLGAEHFESAERTLGALASGDHPLAPRARLQLADLLSARHPKRALSLLQRLTEGHPFSRRAKLLQAMAYKADGQPQRAIKQLEALLADVPTHASGAFAAAPLAEAYLAQGTAAGRIRALSLLRRIESRAPFSAASRQAMARHQQVLAMLPKTQQAKYRQRSIEDEFARGQALMRAHRYDKVVSLFKRVEARVDHDASLLCQAQLQRGRALLKKRKRAEGVKVMETVIDRCHDDDMRAWARYYAGKGHLRLGAPKAALAHYDSLAKEAPNHRLADDGLFQAAIAAADNDDRDGMRMRLGKVVSDHPNGDMRREALFTLAWDARARGEHRQALQYFQDLQDMGNGGLREGMHGRSSYWAARTLQELGEHSKALDLYEQITRSFPLSYHAQLSLARIYERDKTRCKALRQGLHSDQSAELRFAYTPAMRSPAFAAAIALLQIGDFKNAGQELEHIGLTKRGAKPDDLWLVAALYDAAGAYPKASAIARGRLRSFMTEPPTGNALRKWQIAYPKAFAPLVEQAAAEAHVPAAYVRAVAREESAFDPEAVSSAHAYGLIQLMRPTAREHAARLGLPSHPAALKRPEINLRIGSQFIHFLWDRYKDNPAIVPAAYNAGHGSTERWLRARPNMPLDEWVERIPFGETRRYTRRVLQSYGTYAFLYEGHLPPLRQQLPKAR